MTVTEEIATNNKGETQKLSEDTQNLIDKRRQLLQNRVYNKLELIELNKTTKKKIREDMRRYRNLKVKETLEDNKSLKDLKKKMNEGRY